MTPEPESAAPRPAPLLASTWAELKRRKVVRAALTYALVAWAVLQVAQVTYDPLGIPSWAMTWTVLGAILGFPVVLVLAWYFDAGLGGIARESERSTGRGSGRLFAVVVVLTTVLGVGWWLAQVYAPSRHRAAAGDAPSNSIAVLPFDDLSSTHDQAWLADGLAEELLDRLARVPGLRVAARTSSFAFRGRAQDMKEIGRTLHVAYLLEGSVRKATGRVRVTAQLIGAGDGYHLWSETYERSDQDIFALQDQITESIADELKSRVKGIGEMAGANVASTPPTSSHAHELYLEGRQQWRLRTPESLAKAQSLFEQAVAEDPKHARAWSGLADTYLLQVGYRNLPFDEAVKKAEPAVVQAIKLDPKLGEAWASLGLLRMTVGQYEAAQRSLLEAIRLDPRYEMAPMWLAAVYGVQGDYAKQRETLLKAAELNPLEPVINVNLAEGYAATGEVDTARAVLARVLAVVPNDDALLRAASDVERGAGRLDRSLDYARKAVKAGPTSLLNTEALFQSLLWLEDFDAAAQLIDTLPAGRRRAVARQNLLLHRGEATLDPEFTALLEALVAKNGEPTPEEREDLSLAGLVKLAAHETRDAAALLERAAGRPEDLASDMRRLHPASLLVIALRAEKRTDDAARWEQALREVAKRELDAAGRGVKNAYNHALMAVFDNQRTQALAALQQAYDAGYRERWTLIVDPRLAPLRDLPEFKQLEKRIGEDIARMRAARAGA
jgi:TolB-like protein/Tfp pilus assembly protein PilF